MTNRNNFRIKCNRKFTHTYVYENWAWCSIKYKNIRMIIPIVYLYMVIGLIRKLHFLIENNFLKFYYQYNYL